jgi:hypothetical protein
MNVEILKFNDSRISFDITGDLNYDGTRLNRHEKYEKHLLIDNIIVFKSRKLQISTITPVHPTND